MQTVSGFLLAQSEVEEQITNNGRVLYLCSILQLMKLLFLSVFPLHLLHASQYCRGKQSLLHDLKLWQILEPHGMDSLQTGLEGEDSQSELVVQ